MLRKQNISPEAKRAFNIVRDPFSDHIAEDEVYLSPNIRYVLECMSQTARHGGFLAVIGESGSGKSVLRKALKSRLQKENKPIIVIEPSIVGMGGNDKGKTMTASQVAEAIVFSVAPSQKCKITTEARFRQIAKVLKDSYDAGNRHVVIVEEGHDLTPTMLKHFKRFYEMEDGFNRLLSIIIIGQQELATKLSTADAEVREVVQRIEIVRVDPLDDVSGYVAHRCKQVDLDVNKLFSPDAFDAVCIKLAGAQDKEKKGSNNAVTPLAVGNLLTASLNAAVKIGEKIVTRNIILSM